MTWPVLSAPSAAHRLAVVVEVAAVTQNLQECFDQAEAFCTSAGLGEDDAMAIKLSVDEVCTNVVSYAYANAPAGAPAGPMRMEVWQPARDQSAVNTIVLRVMDRGIAFDPSKAKAPDLSADLDEREIGGLGWFLVHEMMDDTHYQRTPDDCNVSTLYRNLRMPAASAQQASVE